MFTKGILAAAIIAGGAGLASLSAQAMVTSIQYSPVLDSGSYEPAAYVAGHVRYNRAMHGNRCRARLGACRHFHNGYYYDRMWWGPGPTYRPGVWVYNSHRHGLRYRHRLNGFNYYYGGYYYARPWWTMAPGITIHF